MSMMGEILGTDNKIHIYRSNIIYDIIELILLHCECETVSVTVHTEKDKTKAMIMM